jgi:hypothetical protein
MELRHIFLIAAILMIGIVAMPQIYSFFSGQHSFYDRGTSECLKCHGDIRHELDSSAHHPGFTCENCHISDTDSNLTHGNVVSPECMDCHGNPPGVVIDANGNMLVAPTAKIFSDKAPNEESHSPFVESAKSSSFMKGENEACIACHTKKSLEISMIIADTYKFDANRITDSTWQLANFQRSIETTGSLLIQSPGSIGEHSFPLISSLRCEKCHTNVREELTNSFHHTFFSCNSCHQISSAYHASSTPPCLTCHGTSPQTVTDQNGNMLIAPIADVYGANPVGADAHIPFVLGAKNSNIAADSNAACSSCHSSFNNNIIFSRPEYIEWDVVNENTNATNNSSGTWVIQNLVYGPTKEIRVTKNTDGKMHDISIANNINCISCHEDIRQAVSLGGHSNEQWMQKHNYANYADMNSYCKSCHQPITQNSIGTSPYPEYPFNSNDHGAISITCMDCHGKQGTLSVNIGGVMQTPNYNSTSMGGIEVSIGQQPAFVRSYLCIACKNTGNPVPNTSLHFRLYTEPQVTIYINGTQQYP